MYNQQGKDNYFFDAHSGKWTSKYHRTPFALHFNGDKSHYLEFSHSLINASLSRMTVNGTDHLQLKNSNIRMNGFYIKFSSLCPTKIFSLEDY